MFKHQAFGMRISEKKQISGAEVCGSFLSLMTIPNFQHGCLFVLFC
jgi:hypothetical protein